MENAINIKITPAEHKTKNRSQQERYNLPTSISVLDLNFIKNKLDYCVKIQMETPENINTEVSEIPKNIQVQKHLKVPFSEKKLIELHRQYGNKWKQISEFFIGKTDTFIKNHFFSLLRQVLRVINNYIRACNKLQKTKNKPMDMKFVFKLACLPEAERIHRDTETNKTQNQLHYKEFLYDFIKIKYTKFYKSEKALLKDYEECPQALVDEKLDEIIAQLKQIQLYFLENNFNKKGKSRKKYPKRLLLGKIRKNIPKWLPIHDRQNQNQNQQKGCDFIGIQEYSKIVTFNEKIIGVDQGEKLEEKVQIWDQMEQKFEQFKKSLKNNCIEQEMQEISSANSFLGESLNQSYNQLDFFCPSERALPIFN